MAGLTLDAGALIAHERRDNTFRELLITVNLLDVVPVVPAVVVPEVWLGGARSARIAALLKVCEIEPLGETLGREAGLLLAATGGSNAIDACVAAGVRRRGDALATSDPDDMRVLLGDQHPIIAV